MIQSEKYEAHIVAQNILELIGKGSLADHFESDAVGGYRSYSLSDLPDLREKLEMAMKLPAVKLPAEKLFLSNPLRMPYEEVTLRSEDFEAPRSLATQVDVYLHAMHHMLNSVRAADPSASEVSIKLPSVNNFADVVDRLGKIEQTFTQTLSTLPEPPNLKERKMGEWFFVDRFTRW